MADSLTVQPLDFTVLIETAATPVTRMETTARDFAQTKLHCLQLNASVGMQRVKAKVFIQDPFNPCSAVHGRFREIRRCAQHCLCPNQL